MDLKNREVLEASGKIGDFHENLLVAEFQKYATLLPAPLELFYWRLSGVNPPEVDLVLRYRGNVIPVEIKRNEKVSSANLRGLRHFFSSLEKKKSFQVPYGILIYRGDFQFLKQEKIFLIPEWFFA